MKMIKQGAIGGLVFGVMIAASARTLEFHVSTSGNDAADGTPKSPFATLERARDAVRALRAEKRANDPVTIWLAAGTYRRTNTFALDDRDSAAIYRAVPGAEVRISGSLGIPVRAVQRATNPQVLTRLPAEVRGKVMEIDLGALGVSHFGELGPRGFRRPYLAAPLELFIDDEALPVAQWPNPGELGVPIGNVLDKGSITRKGDPPERGGTFQFDADRPLRWKQATDVWISGLFDNGYADSTVKVKAFDFTNRTITTLHPHMYGFSSGKPWNRWIAQNLLEEIDLPGEYAVDRPSGKLYFLPPAGKGVDQSRLDVSRLEEPLVAIEGARNVTFQDVILECSRGIGVYIERGSDNRIQNCTLRNLGIVAACIGKGVTPDPLYRHDGYTGQPLSRALGSWHEHLYENPTYNREAGTGQGLVNCHIYNIGQGGISLGGGDRLTLTPAGNFVENCRIHDFNRWARTYKGAINVDGVGNRIAHNLIYRAPGNAIYLHGNDHVIEYNEIHDVMSDGDDQGAFYMGRDPSERNNVIRYNYWHDIGFGPAAHQTFSLYFDDAGGDGAKIYGNVFYKAGKQTAIFLNSGSDIIITNNIFVDCASVIRSHGRSVWLEREGRFEQRLKAVRYNESPWREHYPGLASYLEDRPKMPRGDLLEGNLIVKCGEVIFKNRFPELFVVTTNRVTTNDPGFVDLAHGDFRLKPSADVGLKGFAPVPFDKMGLVPNKLETK
jgi:hypothetical protein